MNDTSFCSTRPVEWEVLGITNCIFWVRHLGATMYLDYYLNDHSVCYVRQLTWVGFGMSTLIMWVRPLDAMISAAQHQIN